MVIKNNFTVDGSLKITSLPVVSNTLSTLMEQEGNVVRRTLGTISTLSKESYLPELSVSFPSILNTNTQSLDYNNRSLVVSLSNQLQGTAFLAPSNMNGTPAFRKIVKSDLNLASVIFDDDNRLHNHSNKSVLDDITSTKVSNWNTAFGWGDFRVYGLGIRTDHNSDANNSRLWDNGFYTLGTSSINRPSYISSSYASGILTISETTARRIQIATGGDATERLSFRSLTDSTQGDWLEFIHDNNLDSKTSALGFIKSSALSGYVPTSRTITAGDGLSGGGNLTANRTISVDGTVVRTSGNQSITGNKEFSNGFFGGVATSYGNLSRLVSGGTSDGDMVTGLRIVNTGTSAGTKARVLFTLTPNTAWENISLEADRFSGINMRFNISIGNGANPPTNIAQFYSDRAEINGNLILGEQGTTTTQAVRADRTLTAGNGLSGGGNLTANRTITLGTPTAIGLSTTNSVASTSHTHALDSATTTAINNGNTAFSWGDFRDYGLGTTARIPNSLGGENNDFDTIPRNISAFIYGSNNSLNTPNNKFPIGIHSSFNQNIAFQLIFDRDNNSFFRTSRGNNIWYSWRELWHSGNLTKLSQLQNDLGFVTTDTKYTAGTGLDLSGTTFSNSAPNIDQKLSISGMVVTLDRSGGSVTIPSSNLITSTTAAGKTNVVTTNTNTFLNIVEGGTTVGSSTQITGTGGTTVSSDANGKITINSTNTNTTYTAGAGLTLSDTAFSLPVTQSGSGNYVSSVVQTTGGITVTKATLPIPALVTNTTATGTTNVATTNTNTYLNIVSGGVATGSSTKVVGAGSVTVASNTSGQLTITGTDTTYSNMSLAELTAGTVTTGRVISAKTINDYMASFSGGVFEKTTEGGLIVKDWNSTANYGGAIAVGLGASALRPNALGMMSGSTAYGINSLSIGVNGQAVGTRSISIGSYSTAFATDSHNFGLGLINRQMGLSIIGRYNDPVLRDTINEIKDDSLLFVIGNGKDSMLKSNSLEHFQDGSTKYFGRQYYNSATRKEEWFQEDNTLVDVAYLKANGSGLTPNPDALPYEAYSGDVLEGQTSNAMKTGEIVYYKEDGTWDYLSSGGSTLNTVRYAVTYGVWLGNGKVLLRGYFKTGNIGTLNRGRVLILKSQTSPTHSIVNQNAMATNDVYLGTVIGTQGVLFFNPK